MDDSRNQISILSIPADERFSPAGRLVSAIPIYRPAEESRRAFSWDVRMAFDPKKVEAGVNILKDWAAKRGLGRPSKILSCGLDDPMRLHPWRWH